MSKKEIELLKSRIEKLEAKDFDLDAWKNHTIVILERIFGSDNQKIRQIEKIEYDYSSWSLRDTSGYSSYQEACKKLSKEILEAAISELENFGLPQVKTENTDEHLKIILNALEDELKISQYKEIVEIASSKLEIEKKRKELISKLNSYGTNLTEQILSLILAKTEFPE